MNTYVLKKPSYPFATIKPAFVLFLSYATKPLEPDNHVVRKTRSQNKADDFELYTGIESLMKWISKNCLNQLLQATSWPEVHESLAPHDLAIQPKGAGFVIKSSSGLSVKASSVSRECSKKRLEEQLGAFIPAKKTNFSGSCIKTPLSSKKPNVPLARRNRLTSLHSVASISLRSSGYTFKPLVADTNTTHLFARFTQIMHEQTLERRQGRIEGLAYQKKAVQEAKDKSRFKRQAIKHYTQGPLNKKILYQLVSRHLKKELARINQQYKAQRSALFGRTKPLGWIDWLQQEAMAGDIQALKALQARKKNQPSFNLKLPSISCSGIQFEKKLTQGHDSITKKGTVIYAHSSSAIRDDGHRLSISRGLHSEGIKSALELAQYRYGDLLLIEGDALFKQQVVEVAAQSQLSITFQDAVMNNKLRDLRQHLTLKETINEPRFDREHDSRRAASSRDEKLRGNEPATERFNDGRGAPGISSTQSRIKAPGGVSPPCRVDPMRELSKLRMDEYADRGEVLLPRDVSSNLEHRRAQSDNGLRRNLREPELIAQPLSPQQHQSFTFIKLERTDEGYIASVTIENKPALLRLSPEYFSSFKRLQVGDKVTLSLDGKVRKVKSLKR